MMRASLLKDINHSLMGESEALSKSLELTGELWLFVMP